MTILDILIADDQKIANSCSISEIFSTKLPIESVK